MPFLQFLYVKTTYLFFICLIVCIYICYTYLCLYCIDCLCVSMEEHRMTRKGRNGGDLYFSSYSLMFLLCFLITQATQKPEGGVPRYRDISFPRSEAEWGRVKNGSGEQTLRSIIGRRIIVSTQSKEIHRGKDRLVAARGGGAGAVGDDC